MTVTIRNIKNMHQETIVKQFKILLVEFAGVQERLIIFPHCSFRTLYWRNLKIIIKFQFIRKNSK
jgi:hypothetical protein